ncbi:VanZ family protein [Blastococcus sp. TF02-09]|uniref:VanZ family protein n=1 Tax=Blastococcus sp. TF02-09 TaxID=2250576 RepID=UPI000DEAEAB3|nr:VanZ family protein [Blastococcus sp. TF02-9]RBY74707.1 VanZ family protein [Blastococcus sp. TF02-9]
MPDRGRTTPARPGGYALLIASLVGVAAATLTPEGSGWAWGSPATETRWYLTGLDSSATLLQLLGNLGLLVVPAALAVLLWPSLRRPTALLAGALAAGTAIELLQWALPLGRVVSPLDAALNAAGAVAAGLLTRSLDAPIRGLARV